MAPWGSKEKESCKTQVQPWHFQNRNPHKSWPKGFGYLPWNMSCSHSFLILASMSPPLPVGHSQAINHSLIWFISNNCNNHPIFPSQMPSGKACKCAAHRGTSSWEVMREHHLHHEVAHDLHVIHTWWLSFLDLSQINLSLLFPSRQSLLISLWSVSHFSF